MLRKTIAAIFAVATLIMTAPLSADETNPVIIHRQSIFKTASSHMTGMKSILFMNGPSENLSYHAEALLAAFQHLGNAFPAGSDIGKTDAKATIWTNPDKFKKAGENLMAAAQTMVATAATGDKSKATEAFKNLSAACKSCHEDFKKD